MGWRALAGRVAAAESAGVSERQGIFLTDAPRSRAADAVNEMRLCWVPKLNGGDDVLAEIFTAPKGKRVPFRAVKMAQFGDVLCVTYRRAIKRITANPRS
jgi:hypothetical protein